MPKPESKEINADFQGDIARFSKTYTANPHSLLQTSDASYKSAASIIKVNDAGIRFF
jgi:hypothetical protein